MACLRPLESAWAFNHVTTPGKIILDASMMMGTCHGLGPKWLIDLADGLIQVLLFHSLVEKTLKSCCRYRLSFLPFRRDNTLSFNLCPVIAVSLCYYFAASFHFRLFLPRAGLFHHRVASQLSFAYCTT